MTKINNADRLIFALDVPDAAQAIRLMDELGDAVRFYKIGLELFSSGDYFTILDALKKRDKRIFADVKFYDIPQTVRSAVKNLAKFNVDFCTVHADIAVVKAAAEGKSGDMKILAVTVLTSQSDDDLRQMGYADNVADTVIKRARYSIENGADGLISSPHEAKRLRRELADLNKDFLIVTPGIRDKPEAEQKRAALIEDAFNWGADYIVVGRPIRDAAKPREAAESIQQRIAQCVGQ